MSPNLANLRLAEKLARLSVAYPTASRIEPRESLVGRDRRSVFVPGTLPSNPLNRRRGWRAVWSEGQVWRRRVATAALLELRGPDHDPKASKRVTLTAFVWNPFDTTEGLRAALKNCVDGLGPRHQQMRRTARGLRPVVGVGAEIVHSDAHDSGHVFIYEQRIDRRRPGVLIEVETLGP